MTKQRDDRGIFHCGRSAVVVVQLPCPSRLWC